MSNPNSVAVAAPARLHFGVLDLAGRLGRCFGGLGAAIPCPSLQIEATVADRLTAEGPDAERALEFARRFLIYHRLTGGAHLLVRRAIPSHSGLGSGTQLDLAGRLGRRFGGLGAAIPCPSLQIETTVADRLTAEGPDAERALEFARRFLLYHHLTGGAHLLVRRAIPSHSGLGSGTQLGLAVARALSDLYGLPGDVMELARATGRGKRSAIGTWAFALGGFIVEGGRRPESDSIAPLLARFTIPETWRYVVAVPAGGRGLSGEAETKAFEELPPPSDREVERVSHLVLMQLLPSLVEGDLASFGDAISQVQRITGGWFAAQQGGIFAPGLTEQLISRMAQWGAYGVGQSSWGPAAYGLVEEPDAAAALVQQVKQFVGARDQVFEGTFALEGARVWGGPGSLRN